MFENYKDKYHTLTAAGGMTLTLFIYFTGIYIGIGVGFVCLIVALIGLVIGIGCYLRYVKSLSLYVYGNCVVTYVEILYNSDHCI